jgi:hypothetical protein
VTFLSTLWGYPLQLFNSGFKSDPTKLYPSMVLGTTGL